MFKTQDLYTLRAVVDIYVREGQPVSSRRLKESAGLAVSTATIRNSMARLERVGWLAKPHTSAGRVPTDEGYRTYVDHLDNASPYGEAFVSRFRDELGDRAVDIGTIMSCASRILGAMSQNFAVVYGAVLQESRVRRVRLVELEGPRMLVVVNLATEHERTSILRFDRRFDSDVIARAENEINHVVTGKTLAAAKETLAAAIRDNITDEGIIAGEIAARREEVFSEPPAVELYFEEQGHVMDQPELSDPKLLQSLLGLLHNKQYLTRILSGRIGEHTQITIGHENMDRQLRPFSFVTAGYRMGTAQGALGIIGPTRMRYDVVRALVRSAARELRAVGEEYF